LLQQNLSTALAIFGCFLFAQPTKTTKFAVSQGLYYFLPCKFAVSSSGSIPKTSQTKLLNKICAAVRSPFAPHLLNEEQSFFY
jgi:hypothetical protein